MSVLKIKGNEKLKDSITRTIRINGETFDKISEIAEEKNISFNNVINQIIEYGIDHIEDKK